MTLKRRIALGAITFMTLTEVGMASSLLLPTPEQLAGAWKLYRASEPAAACTVHLQAPQTLLGGELDCAERLLGVRVTAWLVTPDTLALVGDDGSALRHFNRVKPGVYEFGYDADKTLRLERLDLQ
ncbi:AprI/Inh family metalloprotease inhibitor [Pseudomonas aegrilactucae]|uniref:Protease inhibitor Inh/omp19 family protein n=1 Tax=Pseudomonas aegrilactucae TaxID=2854028 RepID=A0A9Q2XGI4_9PSED|nr:AprI/Inh family metalloprotease inhibitor [Pseudomonas aegrilactucae]MBV6285895.1 protease inhibitor Inh/omp19 family protein [Pseudomonas aegrilactucae]